MGKTHHLFSLKHHGKPIDGVRVQLLSAFGEIIFRTATVSSGRFLIRKDRLKDKPAIIRFLDADAKILSEQKWSKKRNFQLADVPVPKTLPTLARQVGPLLYHHHLHRLTRLLEKYNSDKNAVSHYKRIISSLLPSLNDWDDVVSTSAAVLDGDPMSIQRFRELLTSIKPNYFGGRQPAAESMIPGGLEPQHYPRLCLLGAPVYEQLALATAMVSRTASEYKSFAAQLDKGLAGVRTLERVVNSALPLSDRLPLEQSAHIAQEQINQLGHDLPGLTPWPPGPDGGGIPGLPPIEEFVPEIDWCEVFRQQCIPGMSDAVITSVPEENQGNYRIDSVSPLPAAAGQTITIAGENFGPRVDQVTFPRCGGGVIKVPPASQSETEVTVQVPEDATNGPIGLVILLGTIEICDNVTPIYEVGEPGHFEAASPSIGYWRVNGQDHACVSPGDPVMVEWFACPPGATVELRYGNSAWETVGNTGERLFTAPPVSGDRTIEVRLGVTTPVGTKTELVDFSVVGPLPVIEIREIEFTQGIQTMFRTDGTPDNSLPLVANKDTVARIYIDVDRNGFNNNFMRVTGQIHIADEYLTLRPINSTGLFLNKGPFSENDRTRTNGTLNFLIPATICDRPLELDITIVADWECDPQPTDTRTENISFRNIPAMPVRVRRIRGRAGNAPLPNTALTNVVNAFSYLPAPATNISVLPSVHDVTWDVGLVGGYSTNTGLWILSQHISNEHGAAGVFFDGAIWVGLTHRSNRGIMAWPDSWTCVSHAAGTTEDVFSKTAHEICHCLNFGHVRNSGSESCNDLGLFDTTCEPRRFEGPLPDVPFRVRNNEVVDDPRDLMGYERHSFRFLNPKFWTRAMDEIASKF